MIRRAPGLHESRPAGEDIAIVGMACLVPGADTPGAFWRNIVSGRDCVTDPPPDWQPQLFLNDDRPGGRVYTGRGGYLGDLARFEPTKYGVMPNSVDGAEPDHFLALRCAFEAFADADVPNLKTTRERTGVILGRGTYVNRGYLTLLQRGVVLDQVIELIRQIEPDRAPADLDTLRAELKRHLPPSTAETAPGLAHSVLAGRIANRLDLKGPVYTVDAACASALLAVEQAINELRSGRCDTVLVGGVQVSTPAPIHMVFCQLGALSRSGRISPFSADADGTLLGEGCGMLVLRRRSDAERDGHRIYALLKAVGVASDGKGGGLLAPREEGQVIALRRTYDQAGIHPSSIQLLEAHGTGIPLGDQTEIRSLTSVFGQRAGPRPTVALGSIKSMVSHLIPAAGAVSLIKAALALHHRVLPPTLHAENPSPQLGLDRSPFYLNTQARPWVHGDRETPRRAGVDAFGFGGINAHAILEEVPLADESAWSCMDRHWPVELVVVSAPDRAALARRAAGLADWIERADGVSLLDVAAACARDLQPCRLAICARTVPELAGKLRHAADRLSDPARDRLQDRSGIFWYDHPAARAGRLAFVFPGEGAQYVNMLADLYAQFPEVRRQFDLTDAAYAEKSPEDRPGRSIFPAPGETEDAEAGLLEMQCAIESVGTANRALLALLGKLGVTPQAVVGHSSGEFSALMAAGVIHVADEDELTRYMTAGWRCTSRIVNSGIVPEAALAAVGGVDRSLIEQAVSEAGGRLAVAMDNCPHQLVLVGEPAAMDAALETLKARGALCQRLPWNRAYHTSAFGVVCGVLEDYYALLRFEPPRAEAWSCATADRFPREPDACRRLAVQQWQTKIRFSETIEKMHAAGVRLFVEVGPRGNLSAFIEDILKGKPHAAIPMNLRHRPGLEQLCRAVGLLAAHGVDLNLAALYQHRQPANLRLEADPPRGRPPEPVLRLDLPELKLSDQAAARWREGGTNGPTPAAPPAPRPVQEPAAAAPPGIGSTPAAPAARAGAFADYQKTMRLFLETQQQVMIAAARGLRAPGAPPAGPAPAPPATAAEPALPEKPVSFLKESSEAIPASPPPAPPAHSPAPPAPDAAIPVGTPATSEGASFQDRLLGIVADRTGYPPDMLNPDANLEADLGIDSIKRVEIIGALHRAVLPGLGEPPPWFMERMTAATTLRAIAEGFADLAHSTAATPDPDAPRPADQAPPARLAPNSPHRAPAGRPFIQRITAHEPGTRLVAECDLDLTAHPFLLHHTFGQKVSLHDPGLHALPVMPLAMTMEMIAEAASVLCPDQRVVAMADIQTLRWLAFDRPSRRVRIEAVLRSPGLVHAAVREADGEAAGPCVAEGDVELAAAGPDLGPPTIPDTPGPPSRWTPEELYTSGLFHGPAFRAVRSIDARTPQTVRATLVEPDRRLLLDAPAADALVLPVGLIDGAGQTVGFWGAEEELKMGFPVSLDRLELTAGPIPTETLATNASVRQPDDRNWLSDIEVATPDGRVLLRMRGRCDRILDIPAHYWRYRTAPGQMAFTRDITERFQGIPGLEGCAIRDLGDFPGRALAESSGFRAMALSRLILSRRERATYDGLKSPLEARAAWLLGRTVVKDAVRQIEGRELYMADVDIDNEPGGRPAARIAGQAGPPISLAHTGLDAVAIAAGSGQAVGVGIDIEAVRPMRAELIEDAFDLTERDRIETEARRHRCNLDVLYLAAWGGKEAVGKALGTGVEGGPRSLQITEIDPASRRLVVAPTRAPSGTRRPAKTARETGIEAHWRVIDDRVITVCLIQRIHGGSPPRKQGGTTALDR